MKSNNRGKERERENGEKMDGGFEPRFSCNCFFFFFKKKQNKLKKEKLAV